MDIRKALIRASYFKSNPKYSAIVERANYFYSNSDTARAEVELGYLPEDAKLLENLYKKISNKSVGTNIKKITEGKVTSKIECSIMYASLLTHVLIECKTNPEYKLLVEPTLNQLYSTL